MIAGRREPALARLLAAGAVLVLACDEDPAPRVVDRDALRTHYLVELQDTLDPATGYSKVSHLIVFNPGRQTAKLQVTAFYEDHDPDRFTLEIPPRTTSEAISPDMPIRRNSRFALEVFSDVPVVCQAGFAWTNTGGHFGWGRDTKSGDRPREAARSYPAIRQLARDWLYADGYVMKDGVRHTARRLLPGAPPHTLWIRESEYAILLNPGDTSAEVDLTLHYGATTRRFASVIPPRRLRWILMDDIATPNRHYGVSVKSTEPIALHWLRLMFWHESDEPMTFWSVPGLPLHDSESDLTGP